MQRHQRCQRFGDAFTLLEMLIVIVIIAILMGMTFRLGIYVNQKIGRQRTIKELTALRHAITAFYKEYGYYPPVNHYIMNLNLYPIEDADTMIWVVDLPPPSCPPFLTKALMYCQDGLSKYLFHVPESPKWSHYVADKEICGGDIYSGRFAGWGWLSWTCGGCNLTPTPLGGKYRYESFPPFQRYRLWAPGKDQQSTWTGTGTSTLDDIEITWDE